MKKVISAIVATCLSTVAFAQTSVNTNVRATTGDYRPGEVIVKFKDSSAISVRRSVKGKFSSVGVNTVDKVLRNIGIKDLDPLMPLTGKRVTDSRRLVNAMGAKPDVDLSQLYLLKIDDVQDALKQLKELDEVEYAEPNYLVQAQSTKRWGKNDPLYSQQWGFSSANIAGLWNATAAKKNVLGRRPVIAILDTGVDITHPDLAANIWTNPNETEDGNDNDNNGYKDDLHGWDFVNQTGVLGDYNGHGTHCAGIAAAVGDNGIGIVGANPEALIMPVTILQSNGGGDVATIVKGIDYAYANGADVISMSIGGPTYSMAEDQALSKAYSKCVIVAAAGNDGRCINITHDHVPAPRPMYPGAFTYVIGVQATAPGGGLAGFSNYDDNGPFLSVFNEEQLYNYEISAPGSNILSTYPGGRYEYMSGTSMSTPLVAGVVSRALQYKEYNSKEIIFGDLIHSSAKLFDDNYGGLMDAGAFFNIPETSRKPNLQLVTVDYSDEAGDGDGRIDAGETIDIYPTFRNEWGETYGGVTVHLDFAENEDKTLGEFIQNDVPLGCDLTSYGKAKSQTPVRLKLRKNIADGRVVRLLATASCFNMSDDYKPRKFEFKVENGIELGGTQREDITLYPGVQYIVSRNWGIPKDIKVTVKAGTVIKIKDNVGISNYGYMLFEGTKDSMITITKGDNDIGNIGDFMNDNANYVDFNYVIFENLTGITFNNHRYNNCIIRKCVPAYSVFTQNATFRGCEIYDNTISEPYFIEPCACHSFGKIGIFSSGSTFIETNIYNNTTNHGFGTAARFYKSNYIGNETLYTDDSPDIRTLEASNVYGNYYDFKHYLLMGNGYYVPGFYSSVFNTTEPEMFYLADAYLGTANEKEALRSILDSEDNIGWGTVDVKKMRKEAVEEAPACVDYVTIDGMNPLDDQDEMSPIGVGEHQVVVGFNRVMDQTVNPEVTMGVRPPYTQVNIGEGGRWFDPYTYKATFKITGKTATDGTNRIRVAEYKAKNQGAEFSGPIEKYRYNLLVSAAGSLSTGIMAEAGLGKVMLSWKTDEEDFEDLMGYNLYRFTIDDNGVSSDSVMVNKQIFRKDETQYVDYDVVPGNTYYYFVKEIGTDLTENYVSSVAAATPLTSQKGDANGDLKINIADVMTEIAYLSNEKPQPFIYEAADVNSDGYVDILDVVATLSIITSPEVGTESTEEEYTAYCTIDEGDLFVESPVAIGGVQVLLEGNTTVRANEGVKGMEQLQAQLSDSESIFLSYSMANKVVPVGRQNLLTLNEDQKVKDIVLCTPRGRNIHVVINDADRIEAVVKNESHLADGVYDLTGRRLQVLPKHGIVIMNGKKVGL